jgi:hypothetical protein
MLWCTVSADRGTDVDLIGTDAAVGSDRAASDLVAGCVERATSRLATAETWLVR